MFSELEITGRSRTHIVQISEPGLTAHAAFLDSCLWHLSYAPISMKAIQYINPELLTTVIKDTDILGKEKVLQLIPDIYPHQE